MSDDAKVPLPEPASIRPRNGNYVFQVEPVRAYTAEQMREYATACVAAERERWAKACDDHADGCRQTARTTARYLAKLIRHDGNPPPPKGSGEGWSLYGADALRAKLAAKEGR